jgi:hypothetical protein
LSESTTEQDHNEEQVMKEQVPKITLSGYIVVNDHDESIGRKEDVIIWEENKKKEVRVQKYDESTEEDDDYFRKVFLQFIRLGDSQHYEY